MTNRKERPGLEHPDLSTSKTTGIGSDIKGTEPSRATQANDNVAAYDPFPNGIPQVPKEVGWALAQGYSLIPVKLDAEGNKVPQAKQWNTKAVPEWAIRRRAVKNDPAQLFAVATGKLSGGLLVLDADSDIGIATLATLGLPPTLTTPGGQHVWVVGAPPSATSHGYCDEFPMLEVKASSANGTSSKATFYGTNPHKGNRSYEFTHWPPLLVPYASLPLSLRKHIETKHTASNSSAQVRIDGGPTPEWIATRLADAVAKVTEGEGRNQTGYWFMERLWHQLCDESEMREWGLRYQEAVTDLRPAPYELSEIEDTIVGLLARDQKDRDPEATTNGPSSARPLDLTDTGMARRLVDRFGDEIRYCHPRKRWYVWNGRYWQVDDTGTLMRHAKETARLLLKEAYVTDDLTRRALIAKAAGSYASTMKLRLVVENAQSEPGIAILPADMDPDPFLFNCENGTLNLRTGQLQPHKPGDLITRLAPVQFDAEARSEQWSNFLRHATGGDRALASFLQRAAFASLIGVVEDKAFAYLHGPGNTGKTTFLELLTATWGHGYSGAVDGETFLKRSFAGGIRADLARMDGKRIVISNEMGDGQINEPLLKKLTGGDTITFEEKYVNPWQNAPSFTIWMAGNDVPKALAESEALFNRWRQVPFVNVIPKADPKWLDRAKADSAVRAAVLAWAVRGRVHWERDGIGTAPVVTQATAELRQAMDPLREFWEDFCLFGPELFIESSLLTQTYIAWCDLTGRRTMNDRDFHRLLRNKQCRSTVRKIGGKNRRVWIGIKVAV